MLGLEVTQRQLEEVAEHSGVLMQNDDYLPQALREACMQVIEDPLELEVKDFAQIGRASCRERV